MAPAQRLCAPQIISIGDADSSLGLNGLDDECREALALQFAFQRGQIAERDRSSIRQKRAKSFAPEFVAHQREGSAGQPVERVFRGKYPSAPRMRTRELDGGFHALASRRSEKGFRPPAAGTLTKFFRQFPGKIRNVRLNHRWTIPLQFTLQGGHDFGMIVANIVNAVPGEEVENSPPLIGEEFNSQATFIADIHLQQAEQPHPFGVHSLGIALRRICRLLDLQGCTHCALELETTGSPQSKSANPAGCRWRPK